MVTWIVFSMHVFFPRMQTLACCIMFIYNKKECIASLSSSNMEFHGPKPSFREVKCRICRRLTQCPCNEKGADAVAGAV